MTRTQVTRKTYPVIAKAPHRLRIMLIITGLESGGSEIQLMHLARGLNKTHEVVVMSLTPGGVHRETLRKAGVAVQSLNSKNPLNLISNTRAAIKKFKPDVVHAWLWHASITARLACIGLDVPLIGAMRGQEPTRPRYWVERITRPLVSHYTANSEYIANYYSLRGSKVTIIPNGWPPQMWTQKYGTRRKKHAIAVSRLVIEKDLTTMIHAMKIASDWKLSIVSTGPREPELRTLVAELGLTNVEFLGYRKDVPALVARASCLIHLAFEESSPNAVIEALLLATPVITSDIPALRELVGSRGTLIPNGSPQRLATALQAIASRPNQSTTRAAQIWAQERFALSSMVHAHEALYTLYARANQK